MAEYADLVFVNGPVVTVDHQNRVAQALAVSGNRIAAVGSQTSVDGLKGPNTRVVDLKGRALLPGFVEAHNHMSNWGGYKLSVDCKAPHIKSIEDIKNDIRKRAATQPPGTWVRAQGYNHTKLTEKRHPNRQDLDAAAPDHPVILTRTLLPTLSDRLLWDAVMTPDFTSLVR